MTTPRPGTLGWLDLTVDDADGLRDFYADVVGWTTEALSMGDYDDHVMKAGDEAVAGVCHRRGPNAHLPAVWMPYVVVADLERSLAAVTARGGERVGDVRDGGGGAKMALIRDPAGAWLTLWQPAAEG